jgi:hypothetical protein
MVIRLFPGIALSDVRLPATSPALHRDRLSASPSPTGADLTARIPESDFACLVDRSVVTIVGCTMPPRNPNEDDDEEEEEDRDAESDYKLEPAVIREPDE